MEGMADQNLAIYEPPKQTRSILIYWRLPEEWAEVLYEWVRAVLKVTGMKKFYCDFLGR
jgi:ESCRT-II complex subunit VPS25